MSFTDAAKIIERKIMFRFVAELSARPKVASASEALPHPAPLPLGEGESSSGFWSRLSWRSQDAGWKNQIVRWRFPLPAGEGQGEGETFFVESSGGSPAPEASVPLSKEPKDSKRVFPALVVVGCLLGQSAGASETTQVGPAFSLQERDGQSWLVRPNGERFFSFGVCVVDQGASRADFNPTNPGYAAWQHYRDSNHWAETTLKRLKSWGFTTVGGWSDFEALKQCRESNVVFTPVLHLGSTAGAPWWDMWDTNIIARMHQIARDRIPPLRDDPRVLGYYTDNEMGWWNATLFKMTLEHVPTSGQRQRLIKLLREIYGNDWSELLKDFEPDGVASFGELDQHGMLYLRPGGNGIRAYRRFLSLAADRYYSLMREVIRTYDQRALILGDRYQSFYYPEVARAAAAHVDAVSANLNAAWNDGMHTRFYLDTLRALTGKPVFVSEFYMAARENRSGNQNDRGIFPTVATQKERGAGFHGTMNMLLRTPYVVGADWFQFYDEATYGRGDGENYNFGLLDIHDRPYTGLTRAASALHLAALKGQPVGARLDASHGVPRAPRDPLGQFKPLLALKHWDRERGFVKPASEFPLADLYVCWKPGAIYLGLYAQNIEEAAFYRNKTVPEVDRGEWIICIGETNSPIRIRLGSGVTPVCAQSDVRIASVSGAYMSTRTIAAVELPAHRFGRSEFKAGEAIEFASTFFTHCRANRVEWNGRFTLRRGK